MVTKPFKTERICELAEDVRKLTAAARKRGDLSIVAA